MLGRTDPTELAAHLLRCKVVDLSHSLEEGIPAWPTHARFGRTIYEDYALGDVARHYGMTMSEHTGTHMDAPCTLSRAALPTTAQTRSPWIG